MARWFEPPSVGAEIVHVSPSHLYALLSRLERDAFVAGEEQDAGARPQRRVYSLTAQGRDALHQWLREPVGHPRDMRIEFPLKVYAARLVDPALAAPLLTRQRDTFLGYIERLQSEPPNDRMGFDHAYVDLVRDGRIGRARAAIDWIDACEMVVTSEGCTVE